MPRRKTLSIHVPATQAEAERLVAEIGRIDRAVEREKDAVNDRVTALKERAKAKIRGLNTDAAGKFIALHSYVEAHRSELLPKGRKSVTWPAGVVGFRINPVSVKFKKADEEAIIKRLRSLRTLRFSDCWRVKASLDKVGLVRNRERLPEDLPVRFEREEQFFLKANEAINIEHTVVIERKTVMGDEK